MFPKTVLRQNRRGQRRGQALSFTRSLLLRWRLGERRSLWDEAVMAVERRPLSGAKTLSRDDVCADAGRLVALGRPGQALKRLTSAQKDILPSLFEAAQRHLVSQVCLGGAARIQSCTGSWSAAWVRAEPSAAFDTGLADVAFVDAISMRLGLPVFSAEQACARCPQMLDVYVIMPSLALRRGERSDCTTKSEMLSSDVCRMRRLGLVLNQKASCQRNRGVDRLMFCLCRLPCVDNLNGLYVPT